MSEITNITSFKNTDLLDADDRLMTVKGKSITEHNFKARFIGRDIDQTPQWIRVAKFSDTATGVFTIVNRWYNYGSDPLMIAYAFPSSQLNAAMYTRINVLVGSSPVFTKARIV
ncbi:MAG: hypothetical protein K2L89_00140, partial [Muribaculaceae bacterium]|nr:hypothetical protein [Muribaculaceae bacterium]